MVERGAAPDRLAEIDAPESHQPFGTRAKQALSELVFGKSVRVVVVDIDWYGRTVGRRRDPSLPALGNRRGRRGAACGLKPTECRLWEWRANARAVRGRKA